jgi:hypothetical protein
MVTMADVDKALELLEEAREALAPKYKDNDSRRDTYECGGCAGWTYVPLPAHLRGITCDDFCRGGHERREIEHASYCTYKKIDDFLRERLT